MHRSHDLVSPRSSESQLRELWTANIENKAGKANSHWKAFAPPYFKQETCQLGSQIPFLSFDDMGEHQHAWSGNANGMNQQEKRLTQQTANRIAGSGDSWVRHSRMGLLPGRQDLIGFYRVPRKRIGNSIEKHLAHCVLKRMEIQETCFPFTSNSICFPELFLNSIKTSCY